MKILSCNSNINLAESISQNLNSQLVKAEIKTESSFFQEGYKNFTPEGGSGEGLEIVCEMIENNKRKIIEKTAKEPLFKERIK